MAAIFVDSVGGSNTSPYDTWEKAATTLAAAAGVDAAGDIVYVSARHNETTAGAITLSWAGTWASPTRVLCVTLGTYTGTGTGTLSTMGTNRIANTGANDLKCCDSGTAYFYGINFKRGTSSDSGELICVGGSTEKFAYFHNCILEIGSTAATVITVGNSTNAQGEFDGCTFTFGATSQSISVDGASNTRGIFRNCTISGSAITRLIMSNGTANFSYLSGCDLSAGGATMNVHNTTAPQAQHVVRNCKMPSTWSGSVNGSTPGVGSSFELYNCDDADPTSAGHRLEIKTIFGTVTDSITVYRTSGANDGTNPISWKMVSEANAEWLHQTLNSPEIVRWNETTGSSITVTVEILIDSATTLTNQDVWMEVQYLGTSGYPLSVFDVDSRCAGYLTSSATLTTGTGLANWTGDGGSGNSYKLVSTITPQEKGFIHATIKLAKASTTIYVDPKITVS